MEEKENLTEIDLANIPKSKHQTYRLTLRLMQALVRSLELLHKLSDPLLSEQEREKIQKEADETYEEMRGLKKGIEDFRIISRGTVH